MPAESVWIAPPGEARTRDDPADASDCCWSAVGAPRASGLGVVVVVRPVVGCCVVVRVVVAFLLPPPRARSHRPPRHRSRRARSTIQSGLTLGLAGFSWSSDLTASVRTKLGLARHDGLRRGTVPPGGGRDEQVRGRHGGSRAPRAAAPLPARTAGQLRLRQVELGGAWRVGDHRLAPRRRAPRPPATAPGTPRRRSVRAARRDGGLGLGVHPGDLAGDARGHRLHLRGEVRDLRDVRHLRELRFLGLPSRASASLGLRRPRRRLRRGRLRSAAAVPAPRGARAPAPARAPEQAAGAERPALRAPRLPGRARLGGGVWGRRCDLLGCRRYGLGRGAGGEVRRLLRRRGHRSGSAARNVR